VLIESSTLTVAWIKELAIAAKTHHCALLDAPVTGSKTQAATANLHSLWAAPPRPWRRRVPSWR